MTNQQLFYNIGRLVQVRENTNKPLRGKELNHLPAIDNAWMKVKDGKIEDYGPMYQLPENFTGKKWDLCGRMVLPAWVDSHTHIVYAQSREEEFVMKILGKSYEEIAESGGGILNSALRLRECPEEDLYASAKKRLDEVISLGTGAIEIKSGYGLDTASELKMLRVINRLKEEHPEIPIKRTFLGAHAIPPEFKSNREGYIKQIIEEMLPRIEEQGLADYVDVFCEKGFFTEDESDRILKAGLNHGLKTKVHANELALSGGVQVGVRNNAVSVDHLECMGDEEISLLKDSDTIATLLPSTAFFLDIDYAPARKLIDSGLAVSLASDYNPGTTPSGRLPFVLSLACIKMKMTPEEAINAMTINSAFAMESQHHCGSISRGKLANFIVLKEVPSIAFLPYAFGTDWIEKVYLGGIDNGQKPKVRS
ncbi:MAG: imidazolonepropionase [Saprospirales bacterium]|nr:MAG: imidazolonepropionase [Saprospirales bacterium]